MVIQADMAPKPVLLISKGGTVLGFLRNIRRQYFLSLNKL
jgi:hypothetical protein